MSITWCSLVVGVSISCEICFIDHPVTETPLITASSGSVRTPHLSPCTQANSHLAGNPAPSVTWFKEGKPVRADRVRVTRVGDEATLRIPGASLLDAGEYTCAVNNAAGAIFCTVHVRVEGSAGLMSCGLFVTQNQMMSMSVFDLFVFSVR